MVSAKASRAACRELRVRLFRDADLAKGLPQMTGLGNQVVNIMGHFRPMHAHRLPTPLYVAGVGA